MNRRYKVLVIYYSQSGKTKATLDTFLQGMQTRGDVDITIEEVKPRVPYPLPWPKLYFFGIVPETVYEIPIEIEEPKFDADVKYDLIVLAGQVWFLAPSQPIVSFLQHPKARVFAGTPTVTFLFCRKMWHQTQGRLERRLAELGSWVLDKVVLTAVGTQMSTFRATNDNLFQKAPANTQAAWQASAEALEVVRRQGQQLAKGLDGLAAAPRKPVLTEQSMAIDNRTFVYPEIKAKEFFFEWGRLAMKLSGPNSKRRELLTAYFMASFMAKAVVMLPVHPVMSKIRKTFGHDDTVVRILEIPPLEGQSTARQPSKSHVSSDRVRVAS